MGIFDKVKAAGLSLVAALAVGFSGWAADWDWGSFGPYGPAIGAAVATFAAFAVRETSGYGSKDKPEITKQ